MSAVRLTSSTPSNGTVTTGATSYAILAMAALAFDATEANRQTNFRVAGVLSQGYARVTANATSGASTLRTRVNTANGNITVTITAATTGEFEDVSNTDTIASGDTVNWQCVNGGGGNLTLSIVASTFAATTNTVSQMSCGLSFSTASVSRFAQPSSGAGMALATETQASVKVVVAGTWKNMGARCTAARATATALKTRKNAADGNQTLSITATGFSEDLSNTDTIAVDDLIDLALSTGTGAGTVTVQVTTEFETTTNTINYLSGDTAQTWTVGTNRFSNLAGRIAIATTESPTQVKSRVTPTLSKLRINLITNGLDVTSTYHVRLRINGANGNLDIAFTSVSGTGWLEDASNTDAIAATDEIGVEMNGDPADTGTNSTFTALVSKADFGGAATAALTGTITAGVTEADIVAGGKTIILTLTGDTWVAAGGTFDGQRQNIINGMVSAGSELLGWNNVVVVLQGVAGVVRTSATQVTITLDAFVTYNIAASETITVTIPATALVGAVAIVATPTFTISPVTTGWGPLLAGERNQLVVAG